jgi:hypothetical protein
MGIRKCCGGNGGVVRLYRCWVCHGRGGHGHWLLEVIDGATGGIGRADIGA